MIFFIIFKDYFERNHIYIHYYTPPEYLNQVIEFKCSNNINVLPLTQKPHNSFHMWIENKQALCTFNRVKEKYGKVKYNLFFKKFYNSIMKKLFRSTFRLNKFIYTDVGLLERYEALEDKFKNIDILFLNSQPCSGQYNYNKGEWDNYIRSLNDKYKIVTTTHVDDHIVCTMHNQLTVKSIAALSIHAKIIIGINSGVIPGLLNSYTLQNMRQFYTFDNNCIYTYPNFTALDNIHQINENTLKHYLS
jgi:hypothetical protein